MKPKIHLVIEAAGMAALVGFHALVLYRVSMHLALSAAVITSIVALVFAKHLGLLGALFAKLLKRSQRS